ncbi:MAG: hypothetical protein AB7E81_04660 [Hyphomicrobiaceae bacterium]
MTDKQNKSIAETDIDFEILTRVVDEHAAERGVPSHVLPAKHTSPVKAVEAPRQRKPSTLKVVEPEAPLRKLTLELPEYVIDLLVEVARKQKPRATARYVVLAALRKYGLDIKEADITPDRRRSA